MSQRMYHQLYDELVQSFPAKRQCLNVTNTFSTSGKKAEFTIFCSLRTKCHHLKPSVKPLSNITAAAGTDRLTCWGSSTTVTYSTMFPPPSDTTTEVITHSYQIESTHNQQRERSTNITALNYVQATLISLNINTTCDKSNAGYDQQGSQHSVL